MNKIYKELNLEVGMPIVMDAMDKLRNTLVDYRREGIKYVKIIHGYGSTGKGGAIREACREELANELAIGKIKKIINGEDFKILNREAYEMRNNCKELESLFTCTNKGVTIIEI